MKRVMTMTRPLTTIYSTNMQNFQVRGRQQKLLRGGRAKLEDNLTRS